MNKALSSRMKQNNQNLKLVKNQIQARIIFKLTFTFTSETFGIGIYIMFACFMNT